MAHIEHPLAWAVAAHRDPDQAARYTRYRRYHDGDHDLSFATPRYESTFGQLFSSFSYNRCAVVVDAHADKLAVETFVAEHEAATEIASDIWMRNMMDQRAGEVHKEAFRAGDGYCIVWPETNLVTIDGAAVPTIWPQKASHIRVHYDDERPGLITLASKAWMLHSKRMRLNLYFPDRIEKYITSTRAHSGIPHAAGAFERYEADGEPWPVPNLWGVVPVFHFANNADTGDYGRSELRDVIPLQNALNKVLTDIILTSELAGFPQKVILGIDGMDPSNQDALKRLEGGLNKIFTIPTGAGDSPVSITEFSAANLIQLVAVAELFDKTISRTSRVPVHFLQMSGDFPSGAALRTAESPFTSKIEDRQVAFGNVWENVMALALRQAGMENTEGLRVVWKPAAPMTPDESWNLAVAQKAAGMPFAAILREMGKSQDEIDQIMLDKDAAVEQAMRAFDGGAFAGDQSEDAA